MKKDATQSRISLTLLFAGLIMLFLIVTLAFAVVLGYLLVELGLIDVMDGGHMSLMKTFLLLSVNSLVMGFLLAALVTKYPLKPINKVITQMNRLASGDFSARLSFSGPFSKFSAVTEVCDSFNTMAGELAATEMLRGDFINNFSHEFKTPIVSITGFAKLLRRGNLTEAQKMEYINIIEEESVRLTALANNILNLTRYENQTILTDITEFNLSEQIRSCILMLEGKWAKKDIEFNLNFPEYRICGNRDMLKHTWLNLLDNAIKFSPDGASVDVEIRERGAQLEVAIRNLGEEIPPEKRKRIFQKFYQAEESHATQGNGIGLALVKKVVELHQGTVSVCTECGTVTFTVVLPRQIS